MRILVACEYSGRVREAFRARGHNAWSCDILPAEDSSPYHIRTDVEGLLGGWRHPEAGEDLDGRPLMWDLLIAHPPCTFLANSGVRWLYRQGTREQVPQRWADMRKAARFFELFLRGVNVAKVAVENPIMHKHARELINRPHDQIIQPWMFGHGETKATCLWLKGLPPLVPTNIVNGREHRIHTMAPSPDRWKERSRTYPGIAEAMAEQWG